MYQFISVHPSLLVWGLLLPQKDVKPESKKKTKFNIEKSFKSKVTATWSLRSKLLHYKNKSDKYSPKWLQNNYQVRRSNDYTNKKKKKEKYPNQSYYLGPKIGFTKIRIQSLSLKSKTKMLGTLDQTLGSIQWLINQETQFEGCW